MAGLKAFLIIYKNNGYNGISICFTSSVQRSGDILTEWLARYWDHQWSWPSKDIWGTVLSCIPHIAVTQRIAASCLKNFNGVNWFCITSITIGVVLPDSPSLMTALWFQLPGAVYSCFWSLWTHWFNSLIYIAIKYGAQAYRASYLLSHI